MHSSVGFQIVVVPPCSGAHPRSCDDAAFALYALTTMTYARITLALGVAFAALAATAQTDPLKAAAQEAGAVVTPSGLVYRSLKEGAGPSPSATDTVKVHYRGTFPDGREFDSSHKRNEPATFPLNRVIKCWTEGLQRMKVGGRATLTCPAAIAYGERGAGNGAIPPNAVLRFEVELLGVNP
jgi:FKBP-type peptidyl-prolyl cis-trans isomerase FkpA